jgi:hypothetical protein
MAETTTCEKYLALRRELRNTLSVARKWTTLPGLLDELDRLRSEHDASGTALESELAWIDRFACAVREAGPAVKAEQARRTARALWPWVGAYEPEALPQGHWEALPRSYA